MKTSGVLALVLVAATSLATSTAAAQPREEHGGRIQLKDHRERARPPRPDSEWVALATPTPTRFGTEFIMVGRSAGVFRTLRIEATSGTVYLRRVRVVFSDGHPHTFYLERWLDSRHPVAYVDLGARRQIDQLAITTARTPAGAYAVYGSSGIVVPQRELVSQLEPRAR